jgi:hypothetical protein
MRGLGGVLVLTAACATAVVACGSNGSSPVSASSTSSPTANPSPMPATSAGPAALPVICGIPSPTQLAAVLGGKPAPGSEQDPTSTYKLCNWARSLAPSSTSNVLRLAVVVTTGGGKGFSPKPGVTSVSGVGDSATIGPDSSGGFPGYVLIANKGAYSVSADVEYGGSKPSLSTAEPALAAVVNATFSKLGA